VSSEGLYVIRGSRDWGIPQILTINYHQRIAMLQDFLASISNTQVLAVLIATGAGSVVGGAWFLVFAKEHDVAPGSASSPRNAAFAYFLSPILSLLMAVVLWGLLRIMGPDTVSNPFTAAWVVAMLWAGLSVPAVFWPAIIGVRKPLTATIEAGNWLVQSVLMAIILQIMMW
jgi:hypothetical protein